VLPRIEVNGAQAELVFDGKQRFEKIRLLGEGGLGEVVGAHDHDIGRKVAIKRLQAPRCAPPQPSPASSTRSAPSASSSTPTSSPSTTSAWMSSGELYFVMKYVDGETLESVIEKLASGDPEYHERYTFERRVEIFRALLEALAFAHDRGIIHRDIKPANVMIGKFGEVLLMDWGIAKSLREDARRAPHGRASTPEQRHPPKHPGYHGRRRVRNSLPRLRDRCSALSSGPRCTWPPSRPRAW
jgi:serine/threonine protein kinase